MAWSGSRRSEEHTSELQSHVNLVCRLLLEKKNTSHLRKTGLAHKRRRDIFLFGDQRIPFRKTVISISAVLERRIEQLFFLITRRPRKSQLFPYTTLFR